MVLSQTDQSIRRYRLARRVVLLIALSIVISIQTTPVLSADLDTAIGFSRTGQYQKCLQQCAEAIEDGRWEETWHHLKIKTEMTLGRYEEARKSLEVGLRRYSSSIHLRLIGRDVYRMNNESTTADSMFASIGTLARGASWRYSDRANQITLGRFMHEMQADARQILELFFDRAKALNPQYVEAYIAAADLALDKNDFQVASKELQEALKYDGDNPEILFRLARAFQSSDPEKTNEFLTKTLEINPRYIDGLLFVAENQIDAEQYELAEKTLAKVHAINEYEPRAWGYLAVIAHLRGHYLVEEACRAQALEPWRSNPEIDHLIGLKLSQKYRFDEGAQHQRRVLIIAPNYLPAKIQLSQDLLRLGLEEEGWQLAEEINSADGYNVLAHNMVTLQKEIAKFKTLERDGLIVRMDSREADVYGHDVLDLLSLAKAELGAKYEIEIEEPVIIEIFPAQKDFAIRTFGMPGGAGYLGVCFGKVITANSPASQGPNPPNWQSVLWHEFCHVITLQKTNNRMPRWLSEGISVYEEVQKNPAWGQAMTKQYRAMILGGALTPMSELSSAFMRPPSPVHLNFAYYESSLAIEFIVQEFGIDSLKRVLVDLSIGLPINETLPRHTVVLEQLDKRFELFAIQRANDLAPDADWGEFEKEQFVNVSAVDEFLKEHPNHFAGLQAKVAMLIENESLAEAIEPLEQMIDLFPNNADNSSTYEMLAMVYRKLDQPEKEREVLESLATLDSDNLEAYRRLIEMAQARQDWEAVRLNANRFLAVNPLLRHPHQSLAQSAEKLESVDDSIRSYRALLNFETTDFAETHYRLAVQLKKKKDFVAARRQVLLALEEAPRYRAAHQLYLEIVRLMESESDVAEGVPVSQGLDVGGVNR